MERILRYWAQKVPGAPKITEQFEPGTNALHDAGSAAPNVVQMPLAPGWIEHQLFGANAEQPLASVGAFSLVEQKLLVAAPTLNTEQVPMPLFGNGSITLHCEKPAPFVVHFWPPTGAMAEQSWSKASAKVLHCDGLPAVVGGSTEQAEPDVNAEHWAESGPKVEQTLPLLLRAEQRSPEANAEQVPPEVSVEH